MPMLATPDQCSPRSREKGDAKNFHYNIRLSSKDLTAIDEIQRLMLRRQSKPKQAVSIPLAIRTAVATYAAQLKREEAKAERLAASLLFRK